MGNIFQDGFANGLDMYGTLFNLPETGLSERISGGKKTLNTGRVPFTGAGTSADDTNYVYYSAALNGSAPKTTLTTLMDTVGGGGNDSPITNGSYTGGGSAASQYSAADEQAAYDDQIRALEQLLGYTNTQRDAGLASMIDRFNNEKRTLDDQRARAMEGYRVKETENAQAKERGLGEVDSFANSSYRNLQRLLQGGNAGSSSVARELMPYLVSKAATTRRTGVFDTSGQNARNIDMAKGDAEYQYGMNVQDLENNRKSSEQAFRENILNKQNELGGSLRDLQIKRAMANGKGYAAARAAGDAAQAGITDRQNQLASLFGQYKPTFTAKAMNTKTPELGKYTVDQAAINNSDKNLPAESSFYQTQLKKKQELQGF